jgi:phosphoglycolate phosphatase
MINMKKLLMFDYDGVIADSLDILWECFDKINKKYNFFPFKNKNELTKIWDQNLFEAVSKIGVSNTEFAKFYKEWVDLGLLKNKKVKPFTGLKSVLKKISQNNCLIIISSNDYKMISDFLKRNDLFDYFSLILGSEKGKSKKEKLNLVLNELNFPKSKAYFITDSIGDLKEIKSLGIKTVAVTWGFHDKKKLEKENPDFIVEKPKNLLKLFL